MEYLRVYLQTDGNVKRGSITEKGTGKLVPDKARQIWFNAQSGMICQIDQNGTAFYHCTKIQGDPTFLIRCFPDHFEKKSFDELTGLIDFEIKKEDTHKEAKITPKRKVTKKKK